jgi:hypothetical protein
VDSPFNKVAGLGFGGVPSSADLEEIEQAFAGCGAPVQVELAHLADPAIGALLTAGNYRLVSFENVLGRAIDSEPDRVIPPGVAVRPSGDDEFEPWFELVADGVAHPDADGVPSHEEFPREVVKRAERDLVAAGVARYVALCDGVVVGGAGVRIAEGVAHLTGAATAPAHRRRGFTARCCRPGWPTSHPPAATSPSSPRNRGPSLSRTCSVGALICSTPAPCW